MFSRASLVQGTERINRAYPLPVHKIVLQRASRILIGYVLFCVLAGVVISELSLHLHRRPLPEAVRATAMRISASLGASLQPVQISAEDGVALRAWSVLPANGNGNTVLLL